MMVVAHNYTEMNSLNDLTCVGYTEAHFLYIADILSSHGLNPRFQIFDNQGRYNPASWMIPFRHEFIQTLEGIQHGVFCLSNPSGKRNMCRELHLEAKQFITLIHAKAFVSPLASIDSGVRIDAGVVINGLAKLGDFINIKPNAFIGHHVQIGDFSTIQPSAVIAGGCKLGSCVTIGIGAKLINNVTIGDDTIIGAGSVVTKNIPSGVVAFGNPCRVIRPV
jgi:sugar O-acyltransferase (sialic acid O-acetyltransferase NeuD family)